MRGICSRHNRTKRNFTINRGLFKKHCKTFYLLKDNILHVEILYEGLSKNINLFLEWKNYKIVKK